MTTHGPLELPAITAWTARQIRTRETYHGEQGPTPIAPQACRGCTKPTRSRCGLCPTCQETP